eukprot:jgi/Phyca11/108434/e_gw1.15.565.1
MAFSGGRLNFWSDVWQNVAKMHLLGCMLAIFGTIFTFGLFSTGSRRDGLAIGEQMESVMTDVTAKGSLRHARIAFIHCFAHDINNLVKSVLNTSFRTVTKQASLTTVTLNSSSSK